MSRSVPVPDGLWQALLRHHREEALRIADAARLRGRLQEASAFYQIAVNAGG